ncbi:Nitric oxide synthase-interacting -like protein [Babesia sp. Xinjiang]|uniref:Nitric oxide synthase-interacting -like protein n=1 Tax=Babesia sp. Xinjiang TaxID=462227 RepID=UPI000A22BAF3|nr:Nitric oxide synthase-interacting -like protein [Babesia sp. Xinjiang]ORM40654.1 Nitric oxide synthase-interacting -like protein [Babesia sp. Xinjiang]
MTRHSKNNTSNPIFTYHERQNVRDFNPLRQRLGADSMRKCEQCWLCLSTAVKPVCTPAGYVFCKECILKCCARQLDEQKKEIEQWKCHLADSELRKAEERELSRECKKRHLIENGVFGISSVRGSKSRAVDLSTDSCSSISALSDSNFWVAGAPERRPGDKSVDKASSHCSRPKKGLKCPISGKPLRVKDLVDINPDIDRDSENGVSWLCSVSHQPILHHNVLLDRTTGKLILRRYVQVYDPGVDGQFIALIPGGTGFAAHNGVLANKYRPSML